MRINKDTTGYEQYLKNIKKEKLKILIYQILLFAGFLVLWEVLANLGIIKTFLFSKPSDIFNK